MTLTFIASLLIALAGGGLLTFILCPSLKQRRAGLAFGLLIGVGVGIGGASCLYFLCLAAGLTRYGAALDLALCLVLGAIAFARFRQGRFPDAVFARENEKRSRLSLLIASVFAIELLASLFSFAVAFLKEPHGRWDAWLIWNMHARFLFRSGGQWREAFASGMDWSQWDYPLLLPLSIVRSWQYMGGEGLNVPAVMAWIFTFATLGLLLCALSLLRDTTRGLLAAMVLMGTPFFIAMGASQFADIPFAFFILATLVLFFFPAREAGGKTGALVLAGFCAGLCAWTKNEGLLFLAVAAVSLFCVGARTGGWKPAFRQTAGFAAGALPVLLIVAYFKLRLAPASYLLDAFSLPTLTEKLLDPSRYGQIVRAFFFTAFSFTQGLVDIRVGMRFNLGAVNLLLLPAYLALAGIRSEERDRPALRQAAAVLFLMLIGYFFVYVTTPLELAYHLATSLNRLFLQLWPSTIFIFFMLAGTPGRDGLPSLPGTPPTAPGKGEKQGKNKEPK